MSESSKAKRPIGLNPRTCTFDFSQGEVVATVSGDGTAADLLTIDDKRADTADKDLDELLGDQRNYSENEPSPNAMEMLRTGIRAVCAHFRTTVAETEARELTVAEKWEVRLCERSGELYDMNAALDEQLECHEWTAARAQLEAMRMAIDIALAEIEPLAVEQEGSRGQ